MRRLATAILILLAACGGSAPTAPKIIPPLGVDPVVRGINPAGTALYVAWYAQSGLNQVDTFPANSDRCAVFTSATPVDSVRFVAWIGDTLGAGWSKQSSPWFDPQSGVSADATLNALNYPHGAEFWTITVTQSPVFTMAADSLAPCVP